MKTRFARLALAATTLLCMAQCALGTTAYVSTCEELSAAIGNASVDNIIVTANVDVPCETSGDAGSTDMTGASTAKLIINRSLTLQSQAGSKYIVKRVVASGATPSALKSLIAIRGNGKGESGTANLTENTVEVSFTNIIIDGGANWGAASVEDRRAAEADAYGCSGRATIDVYLGATLNLEDGVEVRNGFTTKSDNSLLNDSHRSACFGGAVRVDYHNNTGGGTINIKAGATIHDCATRGGYGGALGAYNYARLNLYGGTIYNCSADNGGAIACTYRSANDYGDTTAGTIRMYGGKISNCYAVNGGALCTHGPVEDYVLGGAITSCSATYGGAIYQDFNATVVHIVDYDSGKLTISDCVNTNETTTSNTGGYNYVYLSSGSISVTPVYQVTFRDNNANFAVLSVVQGTSLGEAFPAAPVNANFRFVGWYNGNAQFTSSTSITANTIVTAKWDFMGSGTEGDPYLISSTEVWNFLADQVKPGNTYSGKYFLQTANINVSSNLIGYPIDDEHFVTFNGIYDGGGCTIAASISEVDKRYVAPFCCIANATIKNVVVTGSVIVSGGANVGIDRRRHPAGLVGVTDGTCVIQNCRVSADVSGTDYMGGILGHSMNANITMTGCSYNGNLSATGSNYTGGLIGWGCDAGDLTLIVANCLFAGSYSGSGKFHPVGCLYTLANNERTVENTYYTVGLQNMTDEDGNSFVSGLPNKGKFARSITGGAEVTVNLGGPTTAYDVSGITAGTCGLECNGVCYAGEGETVALALSHAVPAPGDTFVSYTVTGGGVLNSATSDTPILAMSNANQTVGVQWGGYGVWAEEKSIAGAWDATDESGVPNAFRYVFDQPAGELEAVSGVDVVGSSVVMTTNAVVNAEGFTIGYALDKVSVAGEVIEEGTPSASAEDLAIDYGSVVSNAYFKVAMVLESTGGAESRTKALSDTTIGVIAITNAPATAIIGVPWVSLAGDGAISVSNLVHTANLTNGDTLQAYEGDTLHSWTLSNGIWVEDDVVGPNAGTGGADTIKINRGKGVWLTRQNPGEPIYLVGEATTDDATSEIVPGTTDKKGWTIVASPSVEPIDLNAKVATADENDQILVPTKGAPKNFTLKDGKWGYDKKVLGEDGLYHSVRTEEDSTIPAGRGFWYINSTDKTSIGL